MNDLTPYERLVEALELTGVNFSHGPFAYTEGMFNWNDIPVKILKNACFEINLLSAELYFDKDGMLLAEGTGDEQPSYDLYHAGKVLMDGV